VLDIGVGGGRTAEFLGKITTNYLGIDYIPELVEAARRRLPGLRFEVMDARDLSEIASGRFAAAVFSLNGIDGMSHSDRGHVVAEVSRVLRPGGWFAYSTHNLAFARSGIRWRPDPRRTIRHPGRSLTFLNDLVRERWDRRRLRDVSEAGEGWALIVSRAYGHTVLWHHVTCAEVVRELKRAGFSDDVKVYAADGMDALNPDLAGALSSPDLHVLARKFPSGLQPSDSFAPH
jgi:SAM-dependent methyltransferase